MTECSSDLTGFIEKDLTQIYRIRIMDVALIGVRPHGEAPCLHRMGESSSRICYGVLIWRSDETTGTIRRRSESYRSPIQPVLTPYRPRHFRHLQRLCIS